MVDNTGLKKFSGKSGRKLMKPVEGLPAVFVVIGSLIILIFAVVHFSNKYTNDIKTVLSLDLGSYYLPDKAVTYYSAKKLQQAFVEQQVAGCPQTRLVSSDDPLYVSSVGNAIAQCELVPADVVQNKEGIYTLPAYVSPRAVKLKELFNLADVTQYNLLINDSTEYFYPVLAPFEFYFCNSNTTSIDADGIGTIIIQSKTVNDVSVLITIKDANLKWFCVGTDTSLWGNHKHASVVGLSENSKVTKGQAGDIICYVTRDATITIEKKAGSTLEPISASSLLSPLSK